MLDVYIEGFLFIREPLACRDYNTVIFLLNLGSKLSKYTLYQQSILPW